MKKVVLAALASFMLSSFALAQNVYKWKDATGKVHYGDIPSEAKVSQVNTQPAMKGAVAPTKAQKDRAEAYLSQAESGTGAMAAPATAARPVSRCPRAR